MATRDDVARLAGVSGASVSRAFNCPDKLDQKTYERIMAAAKALNYHPNYYGSVLRGKHTKQIYTYCPELANPFFVHVYFGMEQCALDHEYQIFLTRTFNRKMIMQGRYDGFLFPIYNYFDILEDIYYLKNRHLPFVTTNFDDLYQTEFYTVGVDVEAAGYCAAEHLCKLGHSDIIYAAPNIDKKWVGILKCCNQYNSNVTPIIYKSESLIINNYEVGFHCAEIINKEQQKPTAIICANDEIAIGLINRLTSLGYRIPHQISVIGFDDINIAKHYIPSLTTIRYPKFQIGYEMARILIAMVNGESVPQNTILQTELIVRESTAPVT